MGNGCDLGFGFPVSKPSMSSIAVYVCTIKTHVLAAVSEILKFEILGKFFSSNKGMMKVQARS